MGRWGVVCDDLLSTVDGDVICRHLGYPLGVSEVSGVTSYVATWATRSAPPR